MRATQTQISCRAVSPQKPNLRDSQCSVQHGRAGMAGQTTFHRPTSPHDGLPARIEGASETFNHAQGGTLPVPASQQQITQPDSDSGPALHGCDLDGDGGLGHGRETVIEENGARTEPANHPFMTADQRPPYASP